MDEFKKNLENIGKGLEEGINELGKAITDTGKKVKEFAQSDNGEQIKNDAKYVASEIGKSIKDLGSSISESFKK